LLASEDSWLQDLVRPLALMAMGRNRAGDAALAAAISGAAGSGWALSVPSGRGTYEIEMARANPRAHILCLSNNWDVLLEARRRATEAGLANLYFIRGIPRLLPVRDSAIGGIWSGTGLHRYPRAERELTQMVRVAKAGAPVAGTSLVRGGPASTTWPSPSPRPTYRASTTWTAIAPFSKPSASKRFACFGTARL